MAVTLVFGASLNPNRYSNMAINKLKAHNKKVVAFGMKSGDVSDVQIDTDLIAYTNIDTVTLYMNSTRQKEYYEYLMELKPRRILFNPGTENPEFYSLLKAQCIPFEQACTLVLLSTNQY